ncbi:MAG TPA: dihydropteroate synthase [Terriglobales bacterium]|nr:dihydropteroate synthase [Terriglobales bacterium]
MTSRTAQPSRKHDERNRFVWRLKSRSLVLGERTLLMGILNVTPDSFFEKGEHFDHKKAVEHGLHLFEQGADILDIGGESTRPGTPVAHPAAVPEGEELRRILPVLEGVLKCRRGAIISVDTYKSCVAKAAIEAGAEIVNDVSGGRWDEAMLKTMASLDCGVVLSHSRGRPQEWKSLPREREIVALVARELGESVQQATTAGVQRARVVVDPGFGFGKGFDENYTLLAHLAEFSHLDLPLLVGTSRKGFIGKTLLRVNESGAAEDTPPQERLYGTIATVTACILQGAHVVRVHDVRAARDAALVADEILRAQ